MRRLFAFLIGVTMSMCFVISPSFEQSRPAAARTQREDKERFNATGAEGTISGTVRFDGDAPVRRRVDMAADANCVATVRNPRFDDVVVTRGALANVFVYVKGGELNRFAFDKPQTGVVLDQRRCQFVPRVLGIQTGQSLIIFNSDPTTHNVHPVPKINQEWNQMQAQSAGPLEKVFTRSEALIPVRCNQHPWMRAYIGVLPHPFFAVSARDGSFKIDSVPPGDYTLVGWHETLGEQTMGINVTARESKSVEFVFRTSAQNSTSTSLSTEAPLEVR